MNEVKPSLYGLVNTNRDFTDRETWGKNQFNSSFPAALCCYLASKNLEANYISISNGQISPSLISIEDVFGIKANDEDAFFAFESLHSPYQ